MWHNCFLKIFRGLGFCLCHANYVSDDLRKVAFRQHLRNCAHFSLYGFLHSQLQLLAFSQGWYSGSKTGNAIPQLKHLKIKTKHHLLTCINQC